MCPKRLGYNPYNNVNFSLGFREHDIIIRRHATSGYFKISPRTRNFLPRANQFNDHLAWFFGTVRTLRPKFPNSKLFQLQLKLCTTTEQEMAEAPPPGKRVDSTIKSRKLLDRVSEIV